MKVPKLSSEHFRVTG